jgi:hypothetical protein
MEFYELRVVSAQRQCIPANDVAESFRGDAQHRTRNLEIPGLALRAIPE